MTAEHAATEKIIITGKPQKVVREYLNQRRKLLLAWPTNHGLLTLYDMSRISGLKVDTLRTRMARYDYDDPKIFADVGELPCGGRPNVSFDIWGGGRLKRDPESIKLGTWELEQLRAERNIHR